MLVHMLSKLIDDEVRSSRAWMLLRQLLHVKLH